MVSLEFFIYTIFLAALWPWGQFKRNVYLEYLLGGKGGRCVGMIALLPLYADFLDIYEPQPPGTLCVCVRAEQGLLDL